jgi:hypothetical protein
VKQALVAYCGKYGPPRDQAIANPIGIEEADVDMADIERRVTGEPLLGGAQMALIEAATERLRSTAGAFSAEDLRVLAWLTEVLGFAPPFQ